MRGFLNELAKVGPFAKQILNYSYPPLLYQRGDGDEDDEDGDDDDEGEDEDIVGGNILAGVDDLDDYAAVREILAGGGQHPDGNGMSLPEFEDDEDYGGVEDDDDREI